MTIAFLCIGLILGFVVGWLLRSKKDTSGNAELQEEKTRSAVIAANAQRLETEKFGLERKLETTESLSRSLTADLARTQEMLRAEADSNEKLQREFENVANRIFDTQSTKFRTLNHEQLDTILSPLKTRLTEFEQKVEHVYRTEAAERNSLRGEIKTLFDLNQRISLEANNLTKALKGDAKRQGNWGEVILERVLEVSGLRKGEEYKTQESFQSHDGDRFRPDAVIYLPENKHLIIDAKVSLVAYERLVSAETEEDRASALLEHLASVKNHIKALSDKNYHALDGLESPDFTLLFMPIESSFGLAIQADNELFNYSWERKIVIVSPSTLLATLRTISSIWKQERQTRNALEIADQGGKMYDKFVSFMEDLVNIGKQMDMTKKSYEGAMNKLSTGSGNLVRRAEQMKELGAKATKQLPQSLLDRAE